MYRHLLLIAAPAVVASIIVLAFGEAGRNTWIVQGVAICVAGALALARVHFPAAPIVLLTVLGIAAPLLSQASGPQRWISIGPMNLYMAPVLLPAFLVACSAWMLRRGRFERLAFTAIAGASLLLAVQPDASQALALLIGSSVAFARSSSRSPVSIAALVFAALATAWAFSRPDPLQSIPYVEGVFALALSRSLLAGAAVIVSAAALVVGLQRIGLSAVAAYYAVLFACSIAGLTPAPLIGFGAGPWLGYGFMIAASQFGGFADAPRQDLLSRDPG